MNNPEFAMVDELAELIRDNPSSKHLVLSVEAALVHFLRADPSPNGKVELQPMGPYHRLLLHRLADIFGFSHESIGKGEDRRLVLTCRRETSIPSMLVSEILRQQDLYQSQATPYEILEREDGSRVLEIKSAQPPTTLVEREEAYQAARQRIFSTYDDGESGEAVRQKPRSAPVVAQRMIAHALGQKIIPSNQVRRDDCGRPSAKAGLDESPDALSRRVQKLSCDEMTSSSEPSGVNEEANGSRSWEDIRREHRGAAKRMMAQALGKQPERRVVGCVENVQFMSVLQRAEEGDKLSSC